MAEISWIAMWLCLMGRKYLDRATAIKDGFLLCGWESVVRITGKKANYCFQSTVGWIRWCESCRFKGPLYLLEKNPHISELVQFQFIVQRSTVYAESFRSKGRMYSERATGSLPLWWKHGIESGWYEYESWLCPLFEYLASLSLNFIISTMEIGKRFFNF